MTLISRTLLASFACGSLALGGAACSKKSNDEKAAKPATPGKTAQQPAREQPAPPAAKPEEVAKEGEPAPDFTFTAHTGATITLSKLRGKPVVLYFYPKDETPG